MNFDELVKKNLRTQEQIEQEKIDVKRQKDQQIAEYIYNIIKNNILTNAHNAKHNGLTISDTVKFPYESGYDDNIPYGNVFSVKIDSKTDRSGGIIGFCDKTITTISVNNIDYLTYIFQLINELSAKDRIEISSPFILLEICDCNDAKIVNKKFKFNINKNKLSATAKTKKRSGLSHQWYGETAHFSLAVDYTYSL